MKSIANKIYNDISMHLFITELHTGVTGIYGIVFNKLIEYIPEYVEDDLYHVLLQYINN
jgi:hypothetical protein